MAIKKTCRLTGRRLLLSVLTISMTAYIPTIEHFSSIGVGMDDYAMAQPLGRMGYYFSMNLQKQQDMSRSQASPSSKGKRRRRNAKYVPHRPHNLTAIRLLGERHSGTNWIMETLHTCFPTINVNTALVNQKHWMQPSPSQVRRRVQRYGRDRLQQSLVRFAAAQHGYAELADLGKSAAFHKTFVVALFRDPYDWMNAMRELPHHWPNHVNWTAFLEANQESIGSNASSSSSNSNYHKNVLERSKQRRARSMEPLLQGPIGVYVAQEASKRGIPKTEFVRQNRAFVRGMVGESRSPRETAAETTKWQQRRRRLDDESNDYNNDSSHQYSVALPWQEFVSRPMTIGSARLLLGNGACLCQKGYEYGTVSPCIRNKHYVPPGVPYSYVKAGLPGSTQDPVYELQEHTGKPFDHPLALRTAKINNLLNLPHEWDLGGFLSVKYEELTMSEQRLYEMLILPLSKAFGEEPKCNPEMTKPRPGGGKRRVIDPDYEQWITEHADWDVEARIGYSPRETL